jgi:hypothetical protein
MFVEQVGTKEPVAVHFKGVMGSAVRTSKGTLTLLWHDGVGSKKLRKTVTLTLLHFVYFALPYKYYCIISLSSISKSLLPAFSIKST